MFLNQQNADSISHRVAKLSFFLCIAVLCSTVSVTAQTEQKLVASDQDAGDEFGVSVATNGDRVVVSAPRNDDAGVSSGSVYIFRMDGISWVQEQKLVASDAAGGAMFGRSVSISGDRVLVGSNADVNGIRSGAAYVFRLLNGNWILEQKLVSSDGADSDNFGTSIAIEGELAVVAAFRDNDNATDAGAVYVFRLVNGVWLQDQELLASDGEADDNFGWSVAISGDRIVIGALGDDDLGTFSGSAYVFQSVNGVWVEEQKLLASDGGIDDRFGHRVSISGDRLVVGAIWSDKGNEGNAGAAYVYHFDGTDWLQEAILTASDAESSDEFGHSVSIDGDRVVVGARKNRGGSAYPFRLDGTTWIEEQKLVPSDGVTFDEFGYSVAISGDIVVVGSRLDDDAGDESGSAYLYELAPVVSGIDDDDLLLKRDLVIYPNPATDHITVEFANTTGRVGTIGIYDMLGRGVAETVSASPSPEISRAQLETSGLPTGVYMVRVENSEGSSSAVFVVTRGN